MKKKLALLIALSTGFTLSLAPTAASAQEFNNGASAISMDMTRVFMPVMSCSKFPFSYASARNIDLLYVRVLNVYGDELGSSIVSDSGTSTLQICSNQDFTKPLILQLESIDLSGPTTLGEFSFTLLERPKVKKKAKKKRR